ncbi:DTW domain-containing protein [Motilimonas cestriensis]|uniref:tRNA-uridine aminocarboxypropyltransferase n=1 Tax=Motilimonas cestriensis TaxID=2742685 RepID=A0ABS8W4D8_9GAMM|nr:tRNA-uridine aminocarboxypropyltransferase [Motilimonas cestriensis]MCE2593252.1 DTW domain-containing protein [Motilimonas cestriensis]
MSTRPWCTRCKKAQVACICHMITEIDNQYKLIILQHPSEANKAIGTARILSLSLKRCEIICSETLPAGLIEAAPTYLLYPSEQNTTQAGDTCIPADSQFVLLDGSWKKAYRLLQTNPSLQSLPCVAIDVKQQTQYKIRKSSKQQGVSSVEAGYYLLSQLEGNEAKYQPLLEVFQGMIDFQLKQMPSSIVAKHYAK